MTGRAAAAAAIASALLCAAATAAADPPGDTDRFAVVIGTNRPEGERQPALRYADDDAVATHELLREAGVESVLLTRLDRDSRRLHDVTPDGAPSWRALTAALARLETRIAASHAAGRRAELLLFYSGHGDVAAGEGYVVLEGGGRLTRSRLHEHVLAGSHADRIHVVVDACKSYFLAFDKRAGGTRRRFGKAFAHRRVPSELPNVGFLLSTSDGRDSHEWERLQAGVFSHEVRSALRGAADADLDGQVTYAELGAFLVTANAAIPNERFRPAVTVRAPGSDRGPGGAVLAWTATASALRLDRDLGHVTVETADGRRVLDAHPAAGQELVLHLPASRPQFLASPDREREVRIDDGGEVPVSALVESMPRVAHRGAVHLAFEQLFARPFGAASVAAFVDAYRSAPPSAKPVAPSVEPAPSPWRRRVQIASIITGAGGAAAGITLSVTASRWRERADTASQADRVDINARIRRLSAGAYAGYAVAGVSAAGFIAASLWPRESAVVVVPEAGGGASLSWSTAW